MNTINLNGPTGGTFTLIDNNQVTEPIRFDASVVEINEALERAGISVKFTEASQPDADSY